MHSSGPFLQLSCAEYPEAVKIYPELESASDLNYDKNGAGASLVVGGHCYFKNDKILDRF